VRAGASSTHPHANSGTDCLGLANQHTYSNAHSSSAYLELDCNPYRSADSCPPYAGPAIAYNHTPAGDYRAAFYRDAHATAANRIYNRVPNRDRQILASNENSRAGVPPTAVATTGR
jgi:hypothetical protein